MNSPPLWREGTFEEMSEWKRGCIFPCGPWLHGSPSSQQKGRKFHRSEEEVEEDKIHQGFPENRGSRNSAKFICGKYDDSTGHGLTHNIFFTPKGNSNKDIINNIRL